MVLQAQADDWKGFLVEMHRLSNAQYLLDQVLSDQTENLVAILDGKDPYAVMYPDEAGPCTDGACEAESAPEAAEVEAADGSEAVAEAEA
jgi:hypothetical protein